MFYLKFMCFFTTFIKKLKNFIKKQRRYDFLKIIVFWHNGLKILRPEDPSVQCDFVSDDLVPILEQVPTCIPLLASMLYLH